MKKKIFIEYCLITFSAFLMALAVNLFFKEHMLAPGGITGLSVVLSSFLNIPVEIISFSISAPLLIMGIFFLGKSFGIKTLYITIMGPLFLNIIPETHITNSLVLAAIIGGLLVGVAISLALKKDCTTGGTDLAAMLIQKILKGIKLPIILFILDSFIVISSGILSQNFMISIYSLLSLLVIIKTIDLFMKSPKPQPVLS